MLADVALSSGGSLVSLGKWKPVLLSVCITIISATVVTLLMSLFGDDRVAGEGD